jgi:hypothetical protein
MKSDNKNKCGLSAKKMTTDKTKNLAIEKKYMWWCQIYTFNMKKISFIHIYVFSG